MIFARYISKEISGVFTAVATILLFVLLSNKFISFLSKAAMGLLPATWIGKIILSLIPEVVSQILPLALFFGVLLAHSRLHADGEYTAMLASGYKFSSILLVTMRQAFFIAALVSLMTLWLVPTIIEKRENLLSRAEAIAAWQAVIPGRFQALEEGRQIFYVEDETDTDSSYKGIFLASIPKTQGDKKDWTIITAKSGDLVSKNNQAYMMLYTGNRYVGVPGMLDFSMVSFDEYRRRINPAKVEVPDVLRLHSTAKLLRTWGPLEKVELQWRMSLPISVFVLAIFAIALAKVPVRQSRFAKMLPGVILYILYFNVMTIVRRGMMAGEIALWGLGAVHIIFMLLGIIIVSLGFRFKEFNFRKFLPKI